MNKYRFTARRNRGVMVPKEITERTRTFAADTLAFVGPIKSTDKYASGDIYAKDEDMARALLNAWLRGNYPIHFESITLILKESSRGGGVQISLATFGFPEDAKMAAYQNYLGGGMLGRVGIHCDIRDWPDNPALVAIADQLRRYYHGLTVQDDDEYVPSSYEFNQKLPSAAY